MITGGKSYVSSPPAFSNDAKRLLVCTGDTVAIFSTSTGLQIASLKGHTAAVTSVIVVPGGKILCYCWTASLDGTIRYWDFSVPELMKKIDIKMPIFSMVIPSLLGEQAVSNEKPVNLFAYLSTEDTKEQEDLPKLVRGQIRKCNLTASRLIGGLILKETPQPEFISVSSSGKFLGIRNKRKLHIWMVPQNDSGHSVAKKITLHHTRNLTVLAFHPTKRIVAAGDTSGRILVWRGFGHRMFSNGDALVSGRLLNGEEERPGVRGNDDAESCSTWHWHSVEVNVLSFSSDGAYLYSGGKEGVLVVWQLETGKKNFLPRIGSSVLHYRDSPDPTLSSISCADNRIHLLKMPSMEILKSISGIKPPNSFPGMYQGSGLAFDYTTGLVALRTENYGIQFYSLFDDCDMYEVQVCERNHQPADEITVLVTSVALSQDGSLMSTAEVKLPEEGIGGLVCLKFWALDSENKRFNLSTVIYEPHRDAGISSVGFHPTDHVSVTSSYGGDFKIWVCDDETQQKDRMGHNSGWVCLATGSYKKKPMTAAAFSSDGSVLAVAAETIITLWDPKKNVLVAVIGETFMPIAKLNFAGKSEYLVSVSQGSNPQLAVWNMSKLSLCWSYKLNAEAVACAADLSSFAVLALLPESSAHVKSHEPMVKGPDGVILLFGVTNPIPVATWSVRKARGGGLAFLQGNPSSLKQSITDGNAPQAFLVYLNGDHEYVLFDPFGNEANELSIDRQEGLVELEETGRFGYTSIYGELAELNIKRKRDFLIPSAPSERPWETLFSGSSHNLPPLTRLCSTFLESLMEKRLP